MISGKERRRARCVATSRSWPSQGRGIRASHSLTRAHSCSQLLAASIALPFRVGASPWSPLDTCPWIVCFRCVACSRRSLLPARGRSQSIPPAERDDATQHHDPDHDRVAAGQARRTGQGQAGPATGSEGAQRLWGCVVVLRQNLHLLAPALPVRGRVHAPFRRHRGGRAVHYLARRVPRAPQHTRTSRPPYITPPRHALLPPSHTSRRRRLRVPPQPWTNWMGGWPGPSANARSSARTPTSQSTCARTSPATSCWSPPTRSP